MEIPSLPYRSVFQNFRARIDVLRLDYIPAMYLVHGAIYGVRTTNTGCEMHPLLWYYDRSYLSC
jgi:hypothetical protein